MSNAEYGQVYEEVQGQKASTPYEEIEDNLYSGKSHSISVTSQHGFGSPTPIRSQKKGNFISSVKGSIRHATKKKTRNKNQDKVIEEKDEVREMAEEEQKEGDTERIRIFNLVKEGIMSVEEAMKYAEEIGIATTAPSTDMEEKIFNFGVYKYDKGRTKCSRRILQFDFQERVLCTIQKGNRNKMFEFSEIRSYESEDGVRFFIYFDDQDDYELDADSVEEKNKICRLLDQIVDQNLTDEADGEAFNRAQTDLKIIKEGAVEKRGHSAAFMMWPRRWLRICPGELSYFKIGEENQEALNIIKLGPGFADIRKQDNNGFLVITNKKEYSFRILNTNNARDMLAVEKERDEFVEAIAQASYVDGRKTRGVSLLADHGVVSTVIEQEKFIMDTINTLQKELEQLTSILTVVNAPIQATVQMKKVQGVVKNLDHQTKTGMLSWTMKQLKARTSSVSSISTTSTLSSREYHGSAPSTPRSFRKSPPSNIPPPVPKEEIEPPVRPPKTFMEATSEISGGTTQTPAAEQPPPRPPKSSHVQLLSNDSSCTLSTYRPEADSSSTSSTNHPNIDSHTSSAHHPRTDSPNTSSTYHPGSDSSKIPSTHHSNAESSSTLSTFQHGVGLPCNSFTTHQDAESSDTSTHRAGPGSSNTFSTSHSGANSSYVPSTLCPSAEPTSTSSTFQPGAASSHTSLPHRPEADKSFHAPSTAYPSADSSDVYSMQRPGTKSSKLSPYEIVSLVPERPPKPDAVLTSVNKELSPYQQPSSLAAPSSRSDSHVSLFKQKEQHSTIYDNAAIKNVRASAMVVSDSKKDISFVPSEPTSKLNEDCPPLTPIDYSSVDAAGEHVPDGKVIVNDNHSDTVDEGGMGCQTLSQAVEERRKLMKEVEKEGVVLLSVDKLKKTESFGESKKAEEPAQVPSVPIPPPPPVPGGIPPPPPPPLSGGMGLDGLPVKSVPQSKVKLKPCFWNKVPAMMVANSMWINIRDRSKSINLTQLEEMFQVAEKEKEPVVAQPKSVTKLLLDPKKAQNLGIFLSGFKLSPQEIDIKLSLFKEEDGALPVDYLVALKRFLPTAEEAEMYKNYKEDISTLMPPDQFMKKLCDVPNLDKRLDLLLAIMDFPLTYEDLEPAVSNLLQACRELCESNSFVVVLEYILTIGNYLNSSSNKGAAYGFRLSWLPKMADIRGNNKKDTLLKFLIMQLQQNYPEAITFYNELKSVSRAVDASVKGLTAEVEVMQKDLGKIKKHSSDLFLKKQHTKPADVKLLNDVEQFVAEYETKVESLCEKCRMMKKEYGRMMIKFGESSTAASDEIFSAVCQFINLYKKALKEIEKSGQKPRGLSEAFATRRQGSSSENSNNNDMSSSTSCMSIASSVSTISHDSVDASLTRHNHAQPLNTPLKQQKMSDESNLHQNSPVKPTQLASAATNVRAPTLPSHCSSPKVIHKQLSVKSTRALPKPVEKPSRSGYLEKLSGGRHQLPKWDQRYFELTETGYLNYYKKPEGKVINQIYLRGCPVEIREAEPCIIVIKTNERDWQLKAVSSDEAQMWFSDISFYTTKQKSL